MWWSHRKLSKKHRPDTNIDFLTRSPLEFGKTLSVLSHEPVTPWPKNIHYFLLMLDLAVLPEIELSHLWAVIPHQLNSAHSELEPRLSRELLSFFGSVIVEKISKEIIPPLDDDLKSWHLYLQQLDPQSEAALVLGYILRGRSSASLEDLQWYGGYALRFGTQFLVWDYASPEELLDRFQEHFNSLVALSPVHE